MDELAATDTLAAPRAAARLHVHRMGRGVAAYLAKAPGTHILLLIIAVTTLVLRGVDVPTATRILRHQSTNLVQMSHDAPRVLLLSAFLSDQARLLRVLVDFTLILVPLERWLGTYRWLCVFVAGHVGATLATTIGIWLQARGGSAGRDLLAPIDVGVSYGLVAAAAVLVYRFRRPVSLALALALLGYCAAGVIRNGTFTDWGHLCAAMIGFAVGPLVRRDTVPPPSLVPRHPTGWRSVSAWLWPPVRVAPRTARRRSATLLAVVLLTTGVAIVVLLGIGGSRSVVIAPGGREVTATVLGRPVACGRDCTTTVMRYTSAEGVVDALLQTPPRTLLRPGERIVVRVDPAAPSRVNLVVPARRVHADGFIGAVAIAAVLGATALLLFVQHDSRGGLEVSAGRVPGLSR